MFVVLYSVLQKTYYKHISKLLDTNRTTSNNSRRKTQMCPCASLTSFFNMSLINLDLMLLCLLRDIEWYKPS